MRRAKSKPAPPILPSRSKFTFDAREAVRGPRLRKTDLPANPYAECELAPTCKGINDTWNVEPRSHVLR